MRIEKAYLIAYILSLLVSGYLSGFIYISQHETAHQMIYSRYGINSTIYIDKVLLAGYTYADDVCPSDSCKMQNAINDIVGYMASLIIMIFWLSWIIYLIFDYERKKIKGFD